MLNPQQSEARRWSVPCLALAIINLFGFLSILVWPGFSGIFGCVAASLILCCGPQTSDLAGGGKQYVAAAGFSIVTAVLDGVSAIVCLFTAIGLFLADDKDICDWLSDSYASYYGGDSTTDCEENPPDLNSVGLVVLFTMFCNLAALAIYATFARKCLRARASLSADPGGLNMTTMPAVVQGAPRAVGTPQAVVIQGYVTQPPPSQSPAIPVAVAIPVATTAAALPSSSSGMKY